ncbi:MaoC family dehydratase [Mycobacterium sp.]|uniref:MaoC family dehydratase n=1 Tax=Mycobacterium sp. TaxID=1785 RepID=UPI0025E14258|nr:MaoC family dehydratase [Mycobacterium sp.]
MPEGPFFDELHVGRVFDTAPAMTLSSGVAATHQAILGDRLRLPLDAHLSNAVLGATSALAHPGLVCDVAIGQSTLATRQVKANLFYRGLVFHRFPVIGDTLCTRTVVAGLRKNKAKSGRAPTGMAALRMTTTDQLGRLVLDFHRCAMLPLSPAADPESHGPYDDLSLIGAGTKPVGPAIENWDRDAFHTRVPGAQFDPAIAGTVFASSADVVSNAPELARLTLNIAAVHHDSRISGRRLVYGGHTIGLALAQASRLLPNLVTVLGWESCDHTGPVHEGDTLFSELHVQAAEPLPKGGGILRLRSIVSAGGEPDRQVLDWRFSALQF